MIKTVVKTALAASLAAGGLVALAATPASAGGITVTAGSGSSISCSITASAKLSPALKNDWVASQHSTDPQAVIAALPNTTFASASPAATSGKGSGTCSGTVTDGVNTLPVTAVSFSITTDPANPGVGPATCASLLTGGTAKYVIAIKYTATGGKVTTTTISGVTLTPQISPQGFVFAGGTIAGSFAGGSDTSTALISPAAVDPVLLQAPETGAQALAGSFTSLGCQPTLKVKSLAGTITSATMKAPKGFKAISIISGSTMAISK